MCTHDGGAYLTKAHAVTPAGTRQDETAVLLVNHEGRAVQMALAERAANLQFLADGERLLGAHNLQLPDAAALATLQGDEVSNGAQVVLQLLVDECRQLLGGVFHPPAVELGGLLVVVVEHLREDFLVLRVTESLGGGANPLPGMLLVRQVGNAVADAVVGNGHQVRLANVLPAVLELLGHAAAALAVAGIAYLVLVHQNLTLRGLHGSIHTAVAGLGDALVALAVVVGADVEDLVVLAVVPANELIVLLNEREEAVLPVVQLLTLLHLSQQPRPADDGMGLQQLDAAGGLHLAGDDADQVFLDGQQVDGRYLVGLHHQSECAVEHLCLLALPVEVDTDGDVVERERSVALLRGESQLAVLVAIPQDAALAELHGLVAYDGFALGRVGRVQGKVNLLAADYADADLGLA